MIGQLIRKSGLFQVFVGCMNDGLVNEFCFYFVRRSRTI